MSNRVRWIVVAVVVVAAVAVAVWFRGGTPETTSSATAPTATSPNLAPDRKAANLPACASTSPAPTGTPLSGVSVTCLANGQPVNLAALLAGGPVLVNVWATYCQPCQQELPALATYAASAGAVRVVEVLVQSDQKDGLDLLASLGVQLTTVFDGSGAASRALKLPEGLPASFLVRANGTSTLITDPRVFTSADQVTSTVHTYLATAANG